MQYAWYLEGLPDAQQVFSANGTHDAQSTILTLTTPGSQVVRCTITDTHGLSSTATITVVRVLPRVNPGAQLLFSGTGSDQFLQPLADAPAIQWSVSPGGGTIDANGLLTAGGTPGRYTVTATSGTVSNVADFIINDVPPTIAQAAAATPNPVTGTTTALTILGADNGGEANLIYTWSVTGPADVSVAPNGTNAAQNATATFFASGAYTFVCTVMDSAGQSASATVATIGTPPCVSPARVESTSATTGRSP